MLGVACACEEFSLDQLPERVKLNFFSAVGMTRSMLPQMRKQRSGNIYCVLDGDKPTSFAAAVLSAQKLKALLAIEALVVSGAVLSSMAPPQCWPDRRLALARACRGVALNDASNDLSLAAVP